MIAIGLNKFRSHHFNPWFMKSKRFSQSKDQQEKRSKKFNWFHTSISQGKVQNNLL